MVMDSAAETNLDKLLPFDATDGQPITPHPPNATIDGVTAPDGSRPHLVHGDTVATSMTPPPSTQVNASRSKDRTPTPTYSSISTPPPTVDAPADHQIKLSTAVATTLSADRIGSASAEELRNVVAELQAVYQEAKMSAAHYKLQYQMLAQESEAAMERMDVEARMAQHESDIIHITGQARAAAAASSSTPVQPSPASDGMIPVQRDLYQYMCLEIQHLNKTAEALQRDNAKQNKVIVQQEAEIETLTDRVALLRDRIRSNREHLNHLRRPTHAADSDFSHSAFTTPSRANVTGQDQFAALLQASEIARKEANPSRKTSLTKSTPVPHPHTTMTPQRYQRHPTIYATPGQVRTSTVPGTAHILPRVTGFRAHDSYSQSSQAIAQPPASGSKPSMRRPSVSRSEETVSNSDRDVDSEAETEIIETDGPVSESQASIKASLMLRSDDLTEQLAASRTGKSRSQPKQTTLFGAVRKHGIDRDDSERPSKKNRMTAGGVGLGIMGARQ